MTHFVEEGYENGIGCYWVIKGISKATDNSYLCKFPYGTESYKLATDVARMLNNTNHELSEKCLKENLQWYIDRYDLDNEQCLSAGVLMIALQLTELVKILTTSKGKLV